MMVEAGGRVNCEGGEVGLRWVSHLSGDVKTNEREEDREVRSRGRERERYSEKTHQTGLSLGARVVVQSKANHHL